MISYWILFIAIAIISYLVQANLKNKFERYSKIPTENGMTGREIAVKMLHDNGIYDVQVTHTPGMLTDHYNPMNKTVNLSEGVYNSNSVAAAAVAAHECGHAVQHARAYAPLRMRSALVPIVQFSSSVVPWVLLIGMLMIRSFPGLMLIGIILFAMLGCEFFINYRLIFRGKGEHSNGYNPQLCGGRRAGGHPPPLRHPGRDPHREVGQPEPGR